MYWSMGLKDVYVGKVQKNCFQIREIVWRKGKETFSFMDRRKETGESCWVTNAAFFVIAILECIMCIYFLQSWPKRRRLD